MFHLIARRMMAFVLPLILLLSACQPIRPEQAKTGSVCTDADKIALLQKYVDAFRNKDPEAGASLFLSYGQLSGTAGPRLDRATGQYKTSMVTFNGHDEILGILQYFMYDAQLTNTIHDPVLQGDTVTAPGMVDSPWYFTHGVPLKEIDLIQTMQVKDCKILHLHWEFPQTVLDAIPVAAKAMASACPNDYKLGVLQTYINGINEADNELAIMPFADTAHFEFEPIPVLDQVSQTYKADPPEIYNSLEQFKSRIDYFISIKMNNILDEKSLSIAGSTLTMSTTLSTVVFTGKPWFLPVTQVNGKYIATFDNTCKIADLKFKQEKGVVEKFTELKKKK